MKTSRTSTTEATLTVSGAELRILNNALNETLDALGDDPAEFETRVGATIDDVRALLDALHPLAKELE